MGTTETLDVDDLRSTILAYRDVLRSHQDVINRLNVYPVPDGDTGTNMALTLESVTAELAQLQVNGHAPDLAATCQAIAHGSLMGARGNSGVILSQLLRGIVEEFDAASAAPGPHDVARAFASADRLARVAVMRPVEGTILTVAKGAAEGATKAAEAGQSLLEVLDAARVGAADALASTPDLLPVLAKAGVVDAGGSGYLLLFDAFLSVVDNRPLPEPPVLDDLPTPFEHRGSNGPGVRSSSEFHAMDGEHGNGSEDTALADLRYEVMYLLEADDETIPAFKEVWAGIGDSIVVVGGNGLWNCHIHTDDIGAAVEASLDAGRPRTIRVTDLLEQVEEERWVRDGAGTAGSGPSETPPGPPPTTGVVAVATGVGIGRIFRSLGVHRLIAGGQSMNPSTAEILEAIEILGSEDIVILPNNKNIRPVAERVAELTGKRIRVIPTDTIAEGFAALLAYDPAADVDVNASAMEASARRVVAGEVTQSVRDTESEVGPIVAGDWLGLSRRGIEVVERSLVNAVTALLAVLVTDEHELVTLIEGDGVTAADTRRVTEWLRENRPGVEAEVHNGGQPLYPYLLSIE